MTKAIGVCSRAIHAPLTLNLGLGKHIHLG